MVNNNGTWLKMFIKLDMIACKAVYYVGKDYMQTSSISCMRALSSIDLWLKF